MKKSALKKRRLEAGMTQKQVADAMGISQPNYQRWEAGNAPVPESKLKKLARTLKTSVNELLGKPAAFDLLGVDNSVEDNRKYYGEVAIHFTKGPALLLSVSEATRERLHRQLDSNSEFINAETLDNRFVFVRREAITDIYFSSEAYDTYGPENYTDTLGVWPDDDFWKIVEHMECPEYLDDEFEESRITEVLKQVLITDEELEDLITTGHIKSEKREEVRNEANELTENFLMHATTICWQLTSGKSRREEASESKLIYETFSLLDIDPDDIGNLIYLPIEGYHRTIMISKPSLDYISIPTHKFNEGALECTEDELD